MASVPPGSNGGSGTISLQRQHRSSRSNSFSSASVVTAKRPGSIGSTSTGARSSMLPIRSSIADDSLAPLRLSRDVMAHEHRRRKSIAVDSSRQASIEEVRNINRWSQSTTSSIGTANHTRRNRSSSGAVLSSLSEQPRSPQSRIGTVPEQSPSPRNQKKLPLWTNSQRRMSSTTASPGSPTRPPQPDTLPTSPSRLPSLHSIPALTDPNDTESPSTIQTIATPSTQSSSAHPEYFIGNEGVSPRSLSKAKQQVQAGQLGGAMSNTQLHAPSTERREQPPNHDRERSGHKRQRTKERTEKDKKVILSKALDKANTAVLLDNAENYEGALEAYSDACDLLQQVMERTSGEVDKQKLRTIRATYSGRIDELRQLLQTREPAPVEKSLPARPMSDESMTLSPVPSASSPFQTTEPENNARGNSITGVQLSAPRLSYHNKERDSFFASTVDAVENSGGVLTEPRSDLPTEGYTSNGPSRGLSSVMNETRSLKRISVHLPPPEDSQYMPPPLSPRRPPSPHFESNDAENDREVEPETRPRQPDQLSHGRAESNGSTSWLNTIDESGSSRSSSVHSIASGLGLRRKHIRGTSGDTDAEFDAAFDAAVEAAYDEGLEPDLESRAKHGHQHARQESLVVPGLNIRQNAPPPNTRTSNTPNTVTEIDEEDRLLDDITQNFGPGFDFDFQPTTVPPRQSDSSTNSTSTRQSSQVSDRATAATSLSTVAEDRQSEQFASNVTGTPSSTTTVRGNDPPQPLSPPPAVPVATALPPPPPVPIATALPQPSGSMSDHFSTVRSARSSGQNLKQLKIETTVKPDNRKRASTIHHSVTPSSEGRKENAFSPYIPDSADSSALTSTGSRQEQFFQSPPLLRPSPIGEDLSRPVTATTMEHRPSYEELPGELRTGSRPSLFRKNKSSASLREHTEHTVLLASPYLDSGPTLMTPMSTTFMTFAAKRNQNPMTSQRANLPIAGSLVIDNQPSGGFYLFDTSLSATTKSSKPRSSQVSQPNGLEPCPESQLLRPFWLMRAIASTITHPRGGFLTTKVFVPREVWLTKGVKLKLVEDKIANCDLLTAALGRLAGVDTYDAEAVMDELQNFEEVMERVQAAMAKKLGSEVGSQGMAGMFKDVSTGMQSNGAQAQNTESVAGTDRSTKGNSGKSYLNSWRRLRGKSSGAPLSTGLNVAEKPLEKESPNMASVPMTNFVPVERRGRNKRDARNLSFDGPHKEYMGSLARLFEGVQALGKFYKTLGWSFIRRRIGNIGVLTDRENHRSNRAPSRRSRPQALITHPCGCGAEHPPCGRILRVLCLSLRPCRPGHVIGQVCEARHRMGAGLIMTTISTFHTSVDDIHVRHALRSD